MVGVGGVSWNCLCPSPSSFTQGRAWVPGAPPPAPGEGLGVCLWGGLLRLKRTQAKLKCHGPHDTRAGFPEALGHPPAAS